MPLGPGDRQVGLVGEVAADEDALARAFDVVDGVARRVAVGGHGADAGGNFVAILDEGELFGHRLDVALIKLGNAFGWAGHALRRRPEIMLVGSRHIGCVREGRIAAHHQPADMVGVVVGDDHLVDLLRRIAGGLQGVVDQVAGIGHACIAVAGVEQHQFRTGIDDYRGERDLQLVDGEEVGLRLRLELFLGGVGAEDALRVFNGDRAVIDGGEGEVAQLEATMGRAFHILHLGLGGSRDDGEVSGQRRGSGGHGSAGDQLAAGQGQAVLCHRLNLVDQ